MMINAVTISEVFAEVSESADKMLRHWLNNRKSYADSVSATEIAEAWKEFFEAAYQKRVELTGKGN